MHPFIILLSAKNEDRLRAYAAALLKALRLGRYNETQLPGIAYTLQTGREAMVQRLAFSVASLEELTTTLQNFVEGNVSSIQCYTGQSKEYKEAMASFLTESDITAMTGNWIQQKQFASLMAAWCKGVPVSWEKLYEQETGAMEMPQRISLPGYPFERKHYWIYEQHTGPLVSITTDPVVSGRKTMAAPEPATQTVATVKEEEPYTVMTFEETWQEKKLEPANASIRQLLCFVANTTHQQQVQDVINALSPATRLVFLSFEASAEASLHQYQIDRKANATAYAAIFRKIVQDHGAIDAMLYLWPVEDASLLKDYDMMVAILQGIAVSRITTRQVVLAAQWQQQDDACLDRCYAESWMGFERSLNLVLPGVQLKAVYEEVFDQPAALTEWASRSWAELNSAEKKSALYKQGVRYVLQVQPAVLQEGSSLLKKQGTYLITGGTGSLGLLFARHLAKQYTANLILTARSAPDAKKQQQLRELEQLGGRVLFLQADVQDREAMQQGLLHAAEKFGTIHGVIHAAGTIDAKLLTSKTSQDFHQVLSPKINGTILLDELLKHEPLRFTCYFTSSSAILGDFGACDYAVANRFQMSFAHSRDQLARAGLRRGKTIAINWPLWKDGGMDLDEAENTRLYLKSSGQRYLLTDEGIGLFEKLIVQEAVQLLVVAGQESKARRFLGMQTTQVRETTPVPAKVITPVNSAVKSRTGDALEKDIIALVSKAQQITETDLLPDDNLADIGFDSISLTELARLLSQHFGVTIAPAIFFGYSTIGKLKEYFLKEQAAVVEALYGANSVTTTAPLAIAQPQDATITKPVPSGAQPAAELPAKRNQAFSQEPIAVIGMSGRFPSARNIEELWQVLAEGRDVVKEIPSERFTWQDYYSPRNIEAGKTNCKWSGLMPGIYEFDPAFFGISPKEAEGMDPRQRLLLQEAWNALEDAGYGPGQINKARIGLFVGAEESGYAAAVNESGLTATHNGILAARLSYFMNLSGPNMSINTACSSGLVAAHQAFQSLQTGECDTAIAAGVNIMYSPALYVGMSQAGMLSDDGKCFVFDKAANGMVPAEAVVAVVLKRLSDAQADGDPIYATIEASGINYDGKTNGITAPNGLAQAALFRSVYDRFGISPESIEYIVTHGTGTRLGDPVEVNALHDCFKNYTSRKGFCALTSAKSNMGHTFAASGLVNMVNLIQAFRYEMIPPTLHCREESDYINWQDTAFYVNKLPMPWAAIPGRERLGAISAFGMSGTNAHMVMRSYTQQTGAPEQEGQPHLLVLSTKTTTALQQRAQELADAIAQGTLCNARLSDIAYTLLAGRHHFKHRVACIVRTKTEAIDLLRRVADKQKSSGLLEGTVSRDFKERPSIKKYITVLAEQYRTMPVAGASHEEDIAALADFYCQGYELPAEQLYSAAKVRRIHLPTYPFAREEYRLQQPAIHPPSSILVSQPANGQPANIQENQEAEAFSLMTFEETWQETAMPSNIAAISMQTLVCFLGNQQQQQIISDYLRMVNPAMKVIFVADVMQTEKHRPLCYQLNGSDETAYKNVLQNIVREHGEPDGILYLFPFEQPSYNKDYVPVFALVRAIYAGRLPIKKLLVSGYWHTTVETGLLDSCYLQSWTGWERTAKTVLPHTALRCVFFETELSPVPFQDWLNFLWQELQVPGNGTVLYRAHQRQELKCRELALSGHQTLLKRGGAYFITGGAGGLGLLMADYLAATYQANIVLVGRSPLDAAKQVALHQLQQRGAQVIYVQADVCSESSLQAALTTAKEKFGSIQGIIHAAGIAGDKNIFTQDYREFEQVLNPKVQGSILLDRLTAGEPLDFMCYFSSGTAMAGDFGTCNYAIANRFQVAHAHYRNQLQQSGLRQGKTLVINWPLWQDGGMQLKEDDLTQLFLRSSGQQLLTTSQGVQIFEQLLAQPTIQVLVMVGNPEKLRQLVGLSAPAAEKNVPLVSKAARLRKPLMEGWEIEQCIEHDLKDQVNQLLKIPVSNIDRNDNLMDIGFDSISLTKLAKALADYYGLEILPAVFFGYPSIEKMAGYLWQEHNALMREVYREEMPAVSAVAQPTSQPVPQSGKMPVVHQNNLPPVAEPIAIIGISGRFAGARDIDAMWKILAEGQHAVTEIPIERFDWRPWYEEGKPMPGKTNCKWSGLVPGVDEFDPLFFEIPPKQAVAMDPRQRLLLQEAWKALEDAGYGANHIKQQKIAMYVGAEESGYANLVGREGNLTANNNAILAARLSYFLNLTGPNMAINTACSSGLVAIHQACLSLRNFECDTAIAAAVNLLFSPEPYVAMSEAGMLSPDGKCYSFDQRANGMVPGEAVTVLVLKRLSQALADGDPVYATIVGSGLNYDGKTNGITAPNGVAQTALLQSVYKQFRVDPADIEYIVAHGTGTSLGDAVEISALQDAFKTSTGKQAYCALTSMKTNFGHTLAASGIVSIIGLVQAFVHHTIPASLHCRDENNHINWRNTPFYVNKQSRPWLPAKGRELTGAVSAFGMSGTNAHLVMQSYTTPQTLQPSQQPPVYLLVLSAKTRTALQEKISDMLQAIESGKLMQASLADITYTLMEGRHHFRYRSAALVRNRDEALVALRLLAREENGPQLFRGEVLHDFRPLIAVKTNINGIARQSAELYANQQQYTGLLSSLARYYCEGYELPAEILYVDIRPRRIHLPTYPFAREKFWVSTKPHAPEQPVVPAVVEQQAETRTAVISHSSTINENGNGNGHAGAYQHLINLFSAVTGLPANMIEADVPFTNYGIDSILIMQLKNRLETITGELPANLFFEYPTIRSLAQYFINTHPGLLTGTGQQPNNSVEAVINDPASMPAYIAAIVSETLGIAPEKIEPSLRLEYYGVDSILMVQLKNRLEKVFGELPVSLFYEYPAIRDLANYFCETATKSPLLVTEDQNN